MKRKLSFIPAVLSIFLLQSVLFADGIGFDPSLDGKDDIIMHPDGGIESLNSEERISSAYGEYIDFNDKGDDTICLGSEGSSGDKTFCVGLNAEETVINSKADAFSINGNLKVWLQKGTPTVLALQSDGDQQSKLSFNEYLTPRGEILTEGKDNSFRMNSLHSSGLYLNGDNKFNVKIASGGGKTSIGHPNPDTTLDVNGALTVRQVSAEPPNPDEGSAVIWMSGGNGPGKKGDILIKITSGNVTRTKTLVAF